MADSVRARIAIGTAIATISLVKMIVGRLIGVESRYTTEPSSRVASTHALPGALSSNQTPEGLAPTSR